MEIPRYGDPELERKLLERSFVNGCKSVLFRSSDHHIQNYQLLADLKESESYDWTTFMLGHLFIPNPKVNLNVVEHFQSEIQDISKHFHLPSLNFVSLPYENFRSEVGDNIDKHVIAKYDSMLDSISRGKVCLGIEFSLAKLLTMTSLEIDEIIFSLPPANDKLKYLIIATNGWTYEHSLKLRDAGKSKGYIIVASETIRADVRRPGTLAIDFRKHDNLRNSKIIGDLFEEDSFQRICDGLLGELRAAIDKCLVMERAFLEKVSQNDKNGQIFD